MRSYALPRGSMLGRRGRARAGRAAAGRDRASPSGCSSRHVARGVPMRRAPYRVAAESARCPRKLTMHSARQDEQARRLMGEFTFLAAVRGAVSGCWSRMLSMGIAPVGEGKKPAHKVLQHGGVEAVDDGLPAAFASTRPAALRVLRWWLIDGLVMSKWGLGKLAGREDGWFVSSSRMRRRVGSASALNASPPIGAPICR